MEFFCLTVILLGTQAVSGSEDISGNISLLNCHDWAWQSLELIRVPPQLYCLFFLAFVCMITIRANQARGLRTFTLEISRSASPLSDSLVYPAPHQPVVEVKVSNVREQSLIIHIVVVITTTVVRPSLRSTLLATLGLEVLFCRLFGISEAEDRGTDWTRGSYLGLASM